MSIRILFNYVSLDLVSLEDYYIVHCLSLIKWKGLFELGLEAFNYAWVVSQIFCC